MYIQEADIFKGLSQETMNQVSRIMVQQSCAKGEVLFTEGDPATHFYILMEGRVRLSVGKFGEIDYTVSNAGEAFGWSSLVGRDLYTAQAECVTPCELIKIKGESLNRIFEREPAGGMLFFKGLAAAIGQRLIHSYSTFLAQQSPQLDTSYGTGQVAVSTEE
jgi:CRP-like cAMP-binding protein